MKKNLYINEGEVKKSGSTLKINNIKIPLSLIDNVFVFDRAKLTTSARNFLLRNKRVIIYLNSKYQLLGILLPELLKSDMSLRIWQYENRDNLDCPKKIVLTKIEAIEQFCNKKLDFMKLKLKEAKTKNEILGIEGNASKIMFDEFKKELNKKGIKEFKKRAYNPPPDRINALLGFLYTLYYSYVFSEIVAYGFDPYIGFLHSKRGTHAVFASDMMEEARVYLTFLAIEILEEIYPDEFDGIYLSLEGRKKVLRAFDNFIKSYNNSLLKNLKKRKCLFTIHKTP